MKKNQPCARLPTLQPSNLIKVGPAKLTALRSIVTVILSSRIEEGLEGLNGVRSSGRKRYQTCAHLHDLSGQLERSWKLARELFLDRLLIHMSLVCSTKLSTRSTSSSCCPFFFDLVFGLPSV
jgi:hypothetical protein